jgi:hypothetical protein
LQLKRNQTNNITHTCASHIHTSALRDDRVQSNCSRNAIKLTILQPRTHTSHIHTSALRDDRILDLRLIAVPLLERDKLLLQLRHLAGRRRVVVLLLRSGLFGYKMVGICLCTINRINFESNYRSNFHAPSLPAPWRIGKSLSLARPLCAAPDVMRCDCV